jgi:hypothetical protein
MRIEGIGTWPAVVLYAAMSLLGGPAAQGTNGIERGGSESTVKLEETVAAVLRDDYLGDLEGLARGAEALARHAGDGQTAAAQGYWRGFALWRIAINRMNAPDFERARAVDELRRAVEAFESVGKGAFLADARSAAAGCLMSLAFSRGPGAPTR